MEKSTKPFKRLAIVAVSAMIALFFNTRPVFADEKYTVEAELYESEPTTVFDTSNDSRVTKFLYGKSSLGEFSVQGKVVQETEYGGKKAFGISGDITVSYLFEGGYRTKLDRQWSLESMPVLSEINNKIGNFKRLGFFDSGLVIFQKSVDGIEWENAADVVSNAFDAEKNYSFTIDDEEVKNGAYYRLITAYKMKYHGNDAISRNCVEIYEFFVSNDNNYVVAKDIISRVALHGTASVESGFYIDKQGSDAYASIVIPSGEKAIVKDKQSFIEPGEYAVTVITKLNYEHSYKVIVQTGMETVSLTPKIYESKKNSGFPEETIALNPLTGDSYTSLTIGQDYGKEIVFSNTRVVPVYGIYGSSLNIFLKLKYPLSLSGNGNEIVYDKWGKNEKEKFKFNETHYGQVGTGALIVQTSTDNRSWINVNKEPYANGLFTTDYGNNYPAGGDVCIYTPSGEDILEGIYIKVMYAYQVYCAETKKDTDYLEVYKFYLCSDELGAVTFHNLSVTEEIEEQFGDWKGNENQINVYKKAESLISGALTCTGFSIDTSGNPTVKYSVTKDGMEVDSSKGVEYKDSGKYIASLVSVAGTKKDVTIYVDSSTAEESLSRYFGASFISGKRIYTEEQYPKYEGGLTEYNIQGVSDSYLPIEGEIRNKTTGSIKKIGATRNALRGTLTEPGNYEAVFSTVSQNGGNKAAGDTRTFTFNFSLIGKGTAPGPQVNQRSLKEYAHKNITDAYPIYYGVTYPSALKGYITIAFATKDAARSYAYNQEKGMVETQNDGSYRYGDRSSQKSSYESNWDLTEATNDNTDLLVEKLYFDLSDESKYRTLKDDELESTKNLRQLELEQSVVIFGEGQKALLTETDALPIISQKHVLYLVPGAGGREERLEDDFRFIKDKYGCDSEEVLITDKEGKVYKIRYNEGVGEQLETQGCASGIVTITEKTHYGDSVSYDAVFISKEVNATQLKFKVYEQGKERDIIVTQHNSSIPEEVDAFSIDSISDELDPYSLVIVKGDKESFFYVAGDKINKVWAEPGVYSVKAVNRIGCAFSFEIKVRESDYVTISFAGDGTEELEDIITQYGSKKVKLPVVTRLGYELAGYTDADGNRFGNEIEEIQSNHAIVLTPVWNVKKSGITIKDSNNKVIREDSADFGTEYTLNVPELSENEKFIGWLRDGSKIEGAVITVDAEEIVLIAVTEKIEIPDNNKTMETQQETAVDETYIREEKSDNNGEDEESGEKSGGKVWIWIIVAAIVIATGYFMKKGWVSNDVKSKGKDSEKIDEEEPNIQTENINPKEEIKTGADKGDEHGEEN